MSQIAPTAERTPLLDTGRIQAVPGDGCIAASPSLLKTCPPPKRKSPSGNAFS